MQKLQSVCTGSQTLDRVETPATASQKTHGAHSKLQKLTVRICLGAVLLTICALSAAPLSAQTFGCTPPTVNDTVCENSKTGNPDTDWSISDVGDLTIQGFTTDISVNQGGTIYFKVKTDAKSYHLNIFRMGYYAGLGAREIATITPSVPLPQTQPACLTDATTNLYDCG